jgi:hypothetical protein
VVPAARRAFEADHWTVLTADSVTGQVVTAWKPIHHALARLFFGKMEARCTVFFRRLTEGRTVLLFQGDLASHHDIDKNPMAGLARRAYASAARDWVRDVRQDLELHHLLYSGNP